MPWIFTMPNHDVTLYAVWVPFHIASAEELVAFSNAVNSGIPDFSGKTVYLDNDIVFTDELSKQFEPIGKFVDNFYDRYFSGTFDGQGHAIKNLELRAYRNVGLFGYSYGVTIKNVVIDESCAYEDGFTSYYGDYCYVGSIIGYCHGESAPCIIENCVNKMSTDYPLRNNKVYIGGIAGFIYHSFDHKYAISVKNCVNYGSITVTGDKSYYQHICEGGIIGYVSEANVHDCTNYGNLTYSGNATGFVPLLDGINGYSYKTTVENCKSYRTITNSSSVTTYTPATPVAIQLPTFESNKVNVKSIVMYASASVGLVVVLVAAVVVVARRVKRKDEGDKYTKVDDEMVV